MRREIADLILSGCYNPEYRKWLAQEAGHLAVTIAHLDEISTQAILPLAKMAAYGEIDARQLAEATGMELADLQPHLYALCEFGFAEETANGFNVTPSGEQAFIAIGKTMLIREQYELKRRLPELEKLYQQLGILR